MVTIIINKHHTNLHKNLIVHVQEKLKNLNFRSKNSDSCAHFPGTRIFGGPRLLSNGQYHCYETSYRFLAKYNDRFSSKAQKCQFLALNNTHIWAYSPETRIFGRRKLTSNCHWHCYQTSEIFRKI